MNEPKTLAKSGWSQSLIEIAAAYLMTVVAASAYFEMHWLIAMAMAPVLLLTGLIGVGLLVQVLWVTVLGIERLGEVFGLRKSPLA